MNEDQIYGVLRHLLSALGGFAVYKGVLTEDEASSVIGGLRCVITTVDSGVGV